MQTTGKTTSAPSKQVKVEIRREYRVAPGSRYTDADAQEIGPALERLAAREGGEILPEAVVQAARQKRSPLHPYFEWDDLKAAEQYRLEQARLLLRSIEIQIITPGRQGEKTSWVREWHSVLTPGDEEAGEPASRKYVSVETVRERQDFLHQIIAEALRSLQGWRARYESYRSLGLFKERFDSLFPIIEEAEKAERKKMS